MICSAEGREKQQATRLVHDWHFQNGLAKTDTRGSCLSQALMIRLLQNVPERSSHSNKYDAR